MLNQYPKTLCQMKHLFTEEVPTETTQKLRLHLLNTFHQWRCFQKNLLHIVLNVLKVVLQTIPFLPLFIAPKYYQYREQELLHSLLGVAIIRLPHLNLENPLTVLPTNNKINHLSSNFLGFYCQNSGIKCFILYRPGKYCQLVLKLFYFSCQVIWFV